MNNEILNLADEIAKMVNAMVDDMPSEGGELEELHGVLSQVRDTVTQAWRVSNAKRKRSAEVETGS